MKTRSALFAALATVILGSGWAASTGPSASPSSLSFSYTVNSTTLPASAKLTISLPASASSSTVISVAPQYPVGTPASQTGWLTIAPSSGHSPLALVVIANPTALPPGSYTVTLSITTNPNVGSLTV